MFTYDWNGLLGHLDHPGGLAEYIGEFLCQFYFDSWVGALIVTALIIWVQQLSYQLIRLCNIKPCRACWFSLLPALFLWAYWLDKNALPSFGISLLLTLYASYGLIWITPKWRIVYSFLVISALYYVVGPVCFLMALFVVVYEWKIKLYTVSLVLYAIAIPLIAYSFLSYPLSRLYMGIGYYRTEEGFSNFKLNMQEEEVLCYDKMVRFKQWNSIIAKAEQKTPSDMVSMQCVNLALSMKGQLVERLFELPQTGTACLISEISDQMSSPYPVSDIHYRLGFINAAERSVYDIQQSQPTPTIRTWIRMVETNIVNGQYAVAKKYLDKIAKTHFYAKWAQKMKEYLNDETKIAENLECNSLRNRRLKEDIYYSSKDMDNMLGRLVMENNTNNQAYDYLVAYLLLKCDLDKFVRLFPDRTNQKMPRVIQEALAFAWMQQNPDFNGIPWNIDEQVLRSAVNFAKESTIAGENPTESLKKKYGHTYWYYYIYTSNRK